MNNQDKRKALAKWILETDENVLNEVEAVYNVYSKNKEILDKRIKFHKENPTAGRNWNEVKTELSLKYSV
ncbi:hypothetical protein MPF19_02300 [Polaribacter sp. Z014]|uniref:hypothetical protein n=1 Tax=Polaribacter sp. Z014 TaxID=2927126 RepID=UPI00201FEEEA|nr:hypothetical protein [Polaribacter sp. Z014]MCL7762231.1 hypothetical protein [Polaribacter sp. Z014]